MELNHNVGWCTLEKKNMDSSVPCTYNWTRVSIWIVPIICALEKNEYLYVFRIAIDEVGKV